MKKITFLKFESKDCVPCKDLSRKLEQLKPMFPEVDFVSVDIKENPALAHKHRVKSLPTCFILDADGMVTQNLFGNIDYNTLLVAIKGAL